MQHVAVSDDIFLAFLTQLAGFFRSVFTAQANEIVIGNRLGPDKPALHIRVDFTRRIRRLGALMDGPGARFLGADGEEGDQVEQVIARADHPGEAGFVEAHFFEEHHPLVIVHAGQLALDCG